MIYRKIFCLKCFIFNSNRIWGHRGLAGRNKNLGNRISWKTLRVERSRWNLMGRISTSSRCGIDIIGTDPLFQGSWRDFQCFGEFGASGCARMMKIGWRVRDLHKMTWLQSFTRFDHLVGLRERRNWKKNEVFLSYEWVIGPFWSLIFRRISWLRALILNPDLI